MGAHLVECRRCNVCDLPVYEGTDQCHYHWLSLRDEKCLICFEKPLPGKKFWSKCCCRPFCYQCIRKWVLKNKSETTCPHCRKSMDYMFYKLVAFYKMRSNKVFCK